MKKILHTLIVSMIVGIFITLNVFATPLPWNPDAYTSVNEVSQLLPESVKQSKVSEWAKARGEFFLRADLLIRNDGDGNVGALAVGYTRFPVDEAYITLYLDRWDATAERWRQVNYYEAEFYAKDYPDGLITPTLDITFTKQERGYYYRLRGAFAVAYNGVFEAFSPTTDGILID